MVHCLLCKSNNSVSSFLTVWPQYWHEFPGGRGKKLSSLKKNKKILNCYYDLLPSFSFHYLVLLFLPFLPNTSIRNNIVGTKFSIHLSQINFKFIALY